MLCHLFLSNWRGTHSRLGGYPPPGGAVGSSSDGGDSSPPPSSPSPVSSGGSGEGSSSVFVHFAEEDFVRLLEALWKNQV